MEMVLEEPQHVDATNVFGSFVWTLIGSPKMSWRPRYPSRHTVNHHMHTGLVCVIIIQHDEG